MFNNKKGQLEMFSDLNWTAFIILSAIAVVGLGLGFALAEGMGSGYSLGLKLVILLGSIVACFIFTKVMFD